MQHNLSGENVGDGDGEPPAESPQEVPAEADADAGDDKKKKKKKNKSKGAKGAAKEQTNPPTIPIAELFPDGKSGVILTTNLTCKKLPSLKLKYSQSPMSLLRDIRMEYGCMYVCS